MTCKPLKKKNNQFLSATFSHYAHNDVKVQELYNDVKNKKKSKKKYILCKVRTSMNDLKLGNKNIC